MNVKSSLQNESINQNSTRDNNLIPFVQDQSHLQKCQQALNTFIEEKISRVDPMFKSCE